MECRFCNTSDPILKENESAAVVFSNPHKIPGHILVMPKRHVEQPWDLTPDELQDIFKLIFFIEQRLVGKLGDGVDIRQSYLPFREEGKLKVKHIAFHVIPRSPDDYIFKATEQYEASLYVDLDDFEREEVAKLLK